MCQGAVEARAFLPDFKKEVTFFFSGSKSLKLPCAEKGQPEGIGKEIIFITNQSFLLTDKRRTFG